MWQTLKALFPWWMTFKYLLSDSCLSRTYCGRSWGWREKPRETLPALEELQWHGRVGGQAGGRRGGVCSVPGDPGSLRNGGRSGGPPGRISKGDRERTGRVRADVRLWSACSWGSLPWCGTRAGQGEWLEAEAVEGPLFFGGFFCFFNYFFYIGL